MAEERGPTLVLLPDPDADRSIVRTVAGADVLQRFVRMAMKAGFSRVLAAPGARAAVDGVVEACTLDPVESPALVAYDTVYVRAALLRLMVLHPLERGETYLLYDAEGRPSALFHGHLRRVPESMDVAEALDLPDELEGEAAIRWVAPQDQPRVASMVLEDAGVENLSMSPWDRWVVRPLLRVFARWGRRPERVELVALALAIAAGLLPMLRTGLGPVLGALALVAATTVQRLLSPLRKLHDAPPPKDRLHAAIRAIGHAAFTAGVTYRLVNDPDRPLVASLVLLAVGGAASFLALLRAREYLQGRTDGPLALQRAEGWIRRMGIEPAPWWRGLPALELAAFVLALTGRPTLPWFTFVLASAARLWRWFVAAGARSRVDVAAARDAGEGGRVREGDQAPVAPTPSPARPPQEEPSSPSISGPVV